MSARYSKLPSEEVELSGRIKSSASSDSSMEGDRFIGPSGIDYSSAFTYDRMKTNRKYFTYATPLPSESLNDLTQVSTTQTVIFYFLVGVCYAITLLTIPISLLFSVKFIQNFERLVIFRLGKMQRAKGPGIVVTLPCIDTLHRVDLREKTFSTTTLHAITYDGGVLQIAISLHYCIRDPVAAVLNVQDLHNAIPALAISVVHRECNKRRLSDIDEDRTKFSNEMLEELSKATYGWGLEIKSIDLIDWKIIKAGNNPFTGILNSLFGGGNGKENNPVLSQLKETIKQQRPDLIKEILETRNRINQQMAAAEPQASTSASPMLTADQLLKVVGSSLSPELVEKVQTSYQFSIANWGEFYLDLRSNSGQVGMGKMEKADVTISLPIDALLKILTNQMSAFEGYTQGLVKVEGSLQAAMRLKEVAKSVGESTQGPSTVGN